MPINKIAYQVLEENQQNYINILRSGQSVRDIGWSTYADPAGTNPVDGVGETASITWAQNTVSPLSGDSDLRLVKDAVNRQGNGVSTPFTIANRHLGKVLQITFDAELITPTNTYENPISVPITGTYSITSTTCTVTAPHNFIQGQSVFMTFTSGSPPANGFYTITSVTATTFVFTVASGSSTGNCNYTTIGDIRISIVQDPTGTPVVLEPVNTNLQLGITNQRIRHVASFQTHISITSYRLCIHVGSASTVAYTVDFANFKVWEPTQSIGSIITDWESYTPSSAITNATRNFKYKRSGSDVILNCAIHWTGAGSLTFTAAQILPAGLSVDTTKLGIVPTNNVRSAIGFGYHIDAAVTNSTANFLYDSSNNTIYTLPSLATPGSGDSTGIEFVLPILGWGSSVAMSSDSGDGRIVNYVGRGFTAPAINTAVNFGTIKDSHGTYNSGLYSVPISGDYRVSLAYAFASSASAGFSYVSINGATSGSNTYNLGYTESTIQPSAGSVIVPNLRAGDTISIRAGVVAFASSSSATLSIERISAGSQVISTTETVSASAYIGGANQTTTSGAIINFNTKFFDTHGAITTGASWRFIAPMTGKYHISVYLGLSNASQRTELWRNGSVYLYGATRQSAGSNYGGNANVTMHLNSGEYIDLRSTSSTDYYGGNPFSTGEPCYISINRIGL
jgi:hypothetical protein